jgi:general secretion pathway protein A
MYETFYGLKERPFSLLPDPDYLYLSPKHMRALTLLEYGMMNQAGFSVICGDTGAGKTTLIRRLLTELGEDTTVGLITNTHKSFGELLSWVLMAFGLNGENKSKANMHQMLIEFLIDQYAQNRHTVLIVDEAQNMTADTLEELRMLSNINSDKDQVLQVILAGQPALRETLRKPELMQFAQRIAVDYYLESLNRDETGEYIQHRLEVAGGSSDIFTEAACHAVYRYSGGTPRLINLLCDTALVYGFAEQTPVIDAPLIEDVVREQHRNSIVPTFNKPLDEDTHRAQKSATTSTRQTQVNSTVKKSKQAESHVNQVNEQSATVHEVEITSKAQTVAADYNSAMSVGHADTLTTSKKTESLSFAKPHIINEHVAQEDETPAPVSKVTHIKKSAAKVADDFNENESAEATNHPASNSKAEHQHAEHRRQTDQPGTDHLSERATAAIKHDKAHGDEDLEARFDEEDTTEQTPYKDVYPIVHIADEPKKNLNFLVMGILGGMVLSLLMFIAAWMMFSNDAPVQTMQNVQPPVQLPSVTDVTPPAPSAEELERIAAIQRERDEAMAATEELKRERDAALAAAQKQEAIRSAEKRANEIIAVQERKYATEMERIRQRAFEAEVAAAKARERERIANEDAEKARLEASRTTSAVTHQPVSAATQPVVTQPAAAQPATPQLTEPNSKPAASTEQTDTKFSANPCNSPSAKFLSTCKK